MFEWGSSAACLGIDPEIFQVTVPVDEAKAKSICAQCPVQSQCLEHAMTHDEVGIWGGLAERERRVLRRRRAARAQYAH